MIKGLTKFGLNEDRIYGTKGIRNSIGYRVTANHSWGNSGGSNSNGSSSSRGQGASGTPNIGGTGITSDYMTTPAESFFPLANAIAMRKVYKDIYLTDLIAGPAVDMQSNIPFSDFSLTGVPDKHMLEIYAKSIEATNIKRFLPMLSVDYLVYGSVAAAFNIGENNYFTSIIPLNLDDCEFTPLPQFGRDPLINYKPPEDLLKLIQNSAKDPRISDLRSFIPDVLEKKAKNKKEGIPLQPETTLFLRRYSLVNEPLGRSYFERILIPILYERLVLRGAVENVMRRLRPILHLTIGLGEEWIPNDDELAQIAELFQSADVDPINSIIATREGISANEIRQPSDFMRYNDEYDSLSSMKLKALGITETMITGEATYNTLDASLTIFLENMKAYRENVTNAIFMQKFFPVIATLNNFKKKKGNYKVFGKYGVFQDYNGDLSYTTSNVNRYQYLSFANESVDLREVDLSEYHIPKITYRKTLQPLADENWLNMLDKMKEQGIPITLRMYMAAAGVDVDEVLNSSAEDIELRKKFAEINKKMPKPLAAEGMEEGGDAFAAYLPLAKTKTNRPEYELRDPVTRKVLSRKGAAIREEKIHKVMAETLTRFGKNHAKRSKQKQLRKEVQIDL